MVRSRSAVVAYGKALATSAKWILSALFLLLPLRLVAQNQRTRLRGELPCQGTYHRWQA